MLEICDKEKNKNTESKNVQAQAEGHERRVEVNGERIHSEQTERGKVRKKVETEASK